MRSGFQSDLEFSEQNSRESSEEHLEPFRAILYLKRKHCFAKKNQEFKTDRLLFRVFVSVVIRNWFVFWFGADEKSISSSYSY